MICVQTAGRSTVPNLALVELRNPGAYLLLRAWWFLLPFVTGAALATGAMSAWTVWGPAASEALPLTRLLECRSNPERQS